MTEFDVNRIDIIFKYSGGSFSPISRIMTEYRKLTGNLGQDEIVKYIKGLVSDGKAEEQDSFNGREKMYRATKSGNSD